MRETLTEEQKELLLKEYATPQAIDRALLIYSLSENGLLYNNSEHILNREEWLFLINELREKEESRYRRTRFKYFYLSRAILRLKDLTTLFEQTFYHGAFRILYVVEATRIEVDALTRSPDVLHSDETFMSDCLEHVTFLEESIERVWNNLIANSIRMLCIYNFIMASLENIHQLNFNFVKISEYQSNFKEIQDKIKYLLAVFSIYHDSYRNGKNELRISPKLIAILNNLGQFDFVRFQPQEKQIIAIKYFLKKNQGFFDRLGLDRILKTCNEVENTDE